MKTATARIAAVALLPALVSGCVAALIPVAAGGIIAGKEKIGIGSASRSNRNVPGEPAYVPVQAMPAPEPIALQGAEQLVFNRAGTRDPQAEAAFLPGMQAPLPGDPAFSRISNYVETQADRDPIAEQRQSAVLAAPGALSPDRSDCSIRPPAVIFDLDPSGETFDPAVKVFADPVLVQMLRTFRVQEISVFWVSTLPALDAGSVRKRLAESGLDPVGRDGLLLMRRADDRKQTRRRELSETHCVMAIAGDTKSDFDELFEYLKDPSAAEPLDELLGAGWFLTPLPLLKPSTTEGQ